MKATPSVQRTVFESWRTAASWAYHVARASGCKTRVRRIGGRWMAWRVTMPHAFELDAATGRCLACGGAPDTASATCVIASPRRPVAR